MDSRASSPLDYAPPPPMYRRKTFRRCVYLALTGALLIVIAIYARPLWDRVLLVYYQRQCLRYSAAQDRQVYEAHNMPHTLGGKRFPLPMAWVKFSQLAGNSVRSPGVAFLHDRKRPDGDRLLVAIHALQTQSGNQRWLSFQSQAFARGNLFHPPQEIATTTRGDAVFLIEPGEVVRVFAGQPDPDDASHFTIDIETNGNRQTLDGWLRDGHTIYIESRPLSAGAQ